MRGQGAIEYFVIFSALLVVFAGVTISQMIDPGREASRDTLRVSQARSAVDTIANAIDGAYANSQGAVITEVVSLDATWDLRIDNVESKLIIGVSTSDGVKLVEDNLRYSFPNLGLGGLDNKLSSISPGSYAVIVEWTGDAKEGIDSALADDKIYIYINPGG